MTERTFRTFKSWDEVSPGDTLLWIVSGKYRGTAVKFVSIENNPPQRMTANCIEVPEDEDPDDYSDTGWSIAKYPDGYGLESRNFGWALEGYETFKYDPTQQPEDDSI